MSYAVYVFRVVLSIVLFGGFCLTIWGLWYLFAHDAGPISDEYEPHD